MSIDAVNRPLQSITANLWPPLSGLGQAMLRSHCTWHTCILSLVISVSTGLSPDDDIEFGRHLIPILPSVDHVVQLNEGWVTPSSRLAKKDWPRVSRTPPSYLRWDGRYRNSDNLASNAASLALGEYREAERERWDARRPQRV